MDEVDGQVSGAAGSEGSAEGNPQLSGFGGAAAANPAMMGVAGGTPSPEVGEPVAVDAGIAPTEDCVLGEFREPELLTGLDQGLNLDLNPSLWSPSLSKDGRTLFFSITADGVSEQIVTATRAGRGVAFSPVAALAEVNSAGANGTALLSADGRSLYFYSTRAGGVGGRDLWLSTRTDAGAQFTAPTLLATVNDPALDHLPWVSPDELTLFWATTRSGGVGQADIWIARRSLRSDGFSAAAPLNGINTTSNEGRAVLTNDELAMFFSSDRPGGVGAEDLWVAARNDREGGFAEVANLATVNSPSLDADPFLSADERELIFASERDGSVRLWRSLRDCE